MSALAVELIHRARPPLGPCPAGRGLPLAYSSNGPKAVVGLNLLRTSPSFGQVANRTQKSIVHGSPAAKVKSAWLGIER
jgi:hypothetical protein